MDGPLSGGVVSFCELCGVQQATMTRTLLWSMPYEDDHEITQLRLCPNCERAGRGLFELFFLLGPSPLYSWAPVQPRPSSTEETSTLPPPGVDYYDWERSRSESRTIPAQCCEAPPTSSAGS